MQYQHFCFFPLPLIPLSPAQTDSVSLFWNCEQIKTILFFLLWIDCSWQRDTWMRGRKKNKYYGRSLRRITWNIESTADYNKSCIWALRSLYTGCFFVQLICMSVIFFKLLSGHEYFHTERKYHAVTKRPFYFSYRGWFSWAFPLQTKTANHVGCVEQMSCLSPAVKRELTWPAPWFERNFRLWRNKNISLLKTKQY